MKTKPKKYCKNRNKKPRLKRFSPREQQYLRALADSLSALIPATSKGDFCLEKIAKKTGMGKYFDIRLSNKRKQFIYFIQQVHGRHQRKFKTITNDILAESVEWRRNKGEPILRAEADTLKTNLSAVGVDLRKEIDDLNLPVERPKITPPPAHIKFALEKFGLHPSLLEKVLPLFADGYLNEAVRKAGEIYETYAIKMSGSGIGKKYGRDLMATVFNSNNPIIKIAGYHNSSIMDPADEREGYMYLAMGAMHWCKNIVGHGDIDQLSPVDASSRIILISHLLEVAETQTRNQESPTPQNSSFQNDDPMTS